MRFSAKITTEEERFDDSSSESVKITINQITTGYEMESIQQTINLRPKNRRASSVPTFKRKSGLALPGSNSRIRKKRDPTFTEEEELELCRIGMGLGGSEERRKEEEELRKKIMRKPSRKVSREGSYVLIQEISGIRMTQTGSQQIREERVLIGSEEYNYMLKKGLLKTTNDLG